ncbi:serine/arginine repetitive matrix protein 2-like [Colletes gigas]|uniref:serine/arginine repetitive matrix protein 2-like n=1 Tax=Colletes gigas TaxID=935657 RepID=UPI001C9A43E5|nr:serine/arginine repetitive matrix protein 2-like [Colletes gigas]
MGKQVPKMSTLVVNAIKNMREVQGSTSKEIISYITSQYSAPESTIQRQMQVALKRGLDYGILKKNNGHYFLNADADVPQIASSLAPAERSRRRRTKRKRGRGRRRRRSGQRRGRRRSRGKRRRSRRRSSRRRGRSGRRRTARTKRVGCTRCRCISKRIRNMQALANASLEPQLREDDMCVCDKESDAERRSGHSKSKERSLSRSRSSANSDRDGATDDRQEVRGQD